MVSQISPAVAGVQKQIVEAARSQSPESIERAIQSFHSVSQTQTYRELPALPVAANQTTPPAAFVAKPEDYLAMAKSTGASGGDLVPLDQLADGLSSHGSRIQKGLESFLQTGIQEALSSLKLPPAPKVASPEMFEPLNDLLAPNQMKNLNASKLKPSIDAVNEMFSTLKKVQNAATGVEINRMRMIRA